MNCKSEKTKLNESVESNAQGLLGLEPRQLVRLLADMSDWYSVHLDATEYSQAAQHMSPELIAAINRSKKEVERFVEEISEVYSEKTGKDIWDAVP